MNEDKAARYRRQRGRLDVAAGVAVTTTLIVLAATRIDTWSRDVLAALVGTERQGPALWWLYGFSLALILEVSAAGFRFQRDVRLEARYRSSRVSADRWLAHRLAAVPLRAAVAGCLTVVLYGLMRAWPATWWMMAGTLWIAACALATLWGPSLAARFFWPTAGLDRPVLIERIQGVAARAGLASLAVAEWRLHPDERPANALLVGGGARRRVLLSSGLLEDCTDDEIEVIVAHELGHVVHRHLWWDLSMDGVVTMISLGATAWGLSRMWMGLGLDGADDVAGLPAACLIGWLVWLMLTPLSRALSRLEERQADRFALRLTGRPQAFSSALRRLGARHLADTRAPMLAARLYDSHPSLETRLNLARNWIDERSRARGEAKTTGLG